MDPPGQHVSRYDAGGGDADSARHALAELQRLATSVAADVSQAHVHELRVKGRSDYLVFELARGRRDRAVRGQKMPFGEGVMGRVAKRQKPRGRRAWKPRSIPSWSHPNAVARP